MLLQGCYLGSKQSARKFRLASWDTWKPARYGGELRFVKIVTNNGRQVPLEQGACYEARVVKHVDSTEEHVCLDADSTHPQQTPCNNYSEIEVVPTFILHPDSENNPANFTGNFSRIGEAPR